MTVSEIREKLPQVAVQMADATIRQARKAITGKNFWGRPDNRADYNLPEVEMASAILFEVFYTYEAAIREALIAMPAEMDGLGMPSGGRKYFDVFVEKLIAQLAAGWLPDDTDELLLRDEDECDA